MFEYILDKIGNVIVNSWLVLGEMSPYLLFGFLMAGVLSIVFSPTWIERHLGGRGFLPVLKSSILGAPLPLCSCGVIPVGASIRRHGASRAATVSFLLSTPQTGIDNISVMWGLLGPVFAAFSPLTALITGLLGGSLVHLFGEKDAFDDAGHRIKTDVCEEDCCAGKTKGNFLARALRFAFLTLPRDIGKPLLFGVLIAGAITAFVPQGELKPYFGNELLSILLMIALGIPFYVCATASVPFAAGLIHMGASPGAALAFLIAGPATNAATITTVWKLLGKRTAILYLLTIALSAIACGLMLNWIMSIVSVGMPELAHVHHHEQSVGWTGHLWAVVLLLVIGLPYFWPKVEAADSQEHDHNQKTGEDSMSDSSGNAMQQLELVVNGMTCGHCTAAVRESLKRCDGVQRVEVDLKNGRALVTGNSLDSQKLVDAVQSLGYEAHR